MPPAKTTRTARPKATFDHLLKKQPVTRRLTIVLDDDAAVALVEAQNEFDRATVRGVGAADAKAALEKCRAEARDATTTLVFQSIGRKRYDELIDEHPASAQQQADADADDAVARYNPETFLPSLIAESMSEPKLSFEEVQALFDEWNNAEVMQLVQTALEVNTVRRTVDMGKD